MATGCCCGSKPEGLERGEAIEPTPLLVGQKEPHQVAWAKVQREAEPVIDDLAMEPHVQQANNIYEAAQSGCSLNVYHMAAFFPRVENFFRAFLCIVLQAVVIPAIVVQTIDTSGRAKGFCPMNGPVVGKLTGATLLLYAFYSLYSHTFRLWYAWDMNCIRKGSPLPKLVASMTWIPLGTATRHCAAACASARLLVAGSLHRHSSEEVLMSSLCKQACSSTSVRSPPPTLGCSSYCTSRNRRWRWSSTRSRSPTSSTSTTRSCPTATTRRAMQHQWRSEAVALWRACKRRYDSPEPPAPVCSEYGGCLMRHSYARGRRRRSCSARSRRARTSRTSRRSSRIAASSSRSTSSAAGASSRCSPTI